MDGPVDARSVCASTTGSTTGTTPRNTLNERLTGTKETPRNARRSRGGVTFESVVLRDGLVLRIGNVSLIPTATDVSAVGGTMCHSKPTTLSLLRLVGRVTPRTSSPFASRAIPAKGPRSWTSGRDAILSLASVICTCYAEIRQTSMEIRERNDASGVRIED